MIKKGLVYVFEGDGKGKTSAALGVAVRMLLNQKKVVWVSWYKTPEWQISEAGLTKYFDGKLKMFFMGEGFFLNESENVRVGKNQLKYAFTKKTKVYDNSTPDKHRDAAISAVNLALDILKEKDPPDLIVLDEAMKAINDGLLSEKKVLEIISKRKNTHLVITGHVAPENIIKVADLVTKMNKIKHPYDRGVLAVKGLDY